MLVLLSGPEKSEILIIMAVSYLNLHVVVMDNQVVSLFSELLYVNKVVNLAKLKTKDSLWNNRQFGQLKKSLYAS